MWVGSLCDEEAARKACGSAIMANENLGLGTSDLATVATAQAASVAAVAARSVCDQPIGIQCSRGFEIANNFGATFGSTFAVLEASLPSSAGHPRQMITG